MSRLCYVAHPIGALTPLGVLENVERCRRWLRFLTLHEGKGGDRAFIAPYLDWMSILDEQKEGHRAWGLRMAIEVAKRCDEFWPVGRQAALGHTEMGVPVGVESFAGNRWVLALTSGMSLEHTAWMGTRARGLYESGLRREYLLHHEPPALETES